MCNFQVYFILICFEHATLDGIVNAMHVPTFRIAGGKRDMMVERRQQVFVCSLPTRNTTSLYSSLQQLGIHCVCGHLIAPTTVLAPE